MGKSQSKLSSSQGLKKALLIGINYIEDPSNKLDGCINDVKNVKTQINKMYPKCNQFRVLTDDLTKLEEKPTRQNIIDGINWLVKDLKAGENVYFHFSGHGGLTVDLSKDEKTGMAFIAQQLAQIEYNTRNSARAQEKGNRIAQI